MEINEEEAKMVQRVFELYSTGEIGIRKIGIQLAKEGILSRKGKPLCYSTLRRMIENPKYKGFYCGKKTETIDFMTRERIFIPEEEWVTYKTTDEIVPQIVEDDVWEKCKEIRNKRSCKYTGIGDRWHNRYKYSNLLECVHDNQTYWRRKNRPTAKEEFWTCSGFASSGMHKCHNNIHIGTEELDKILYDIFSEMLENKNKILKEMLKRNNDLCQANEEEKTQMDSVENTINELENRKENLIKLYTMNRITDDEFEKINNEYQEQIIKYKTQLINIKIKQSAKEKGRNQEKIKKFFDFDAVELTKEFIHKKICKIYVEYIEKNHAKLKINFHFDLEMSEVDKKSICLGLII